MNFVFDIGNVLLHFKPREYVDLLFEDRARADAMLRVVFGSGEWQDLDRGMLTHARATDIFCAREPSLEGDIRLTMGRVMEMLTPMPEAESMLREVAAKGHALFYLSNYHAETRDYVLSKYPFFGLFRGGVFSCDVHINKPDPGIYRRLLDEYELRPEDCVFFDDTLVNAQAASALGIRGVWFRSPEDVYALL